MKTLGKKRRPDRTVSEPRKPRRSWGVWVYFTVLIFFLYSIARLFFEGHFVFRANGEVTQETLLLETTVVSEVVEVYVRPGDEVAKGDLLMQVNSADYRARLAELAINLERLETTQRRSHEEREAAEEKVPLWTAELRTLQGDLKKIQRLKGLPENYSKVRELQQRIGEIQRDLVDLQQVAKREDHSDYAVSVAAQHLRELNNSFLTGEVRARTAGTVGLDIAHAGEVLNIGETYLELKVGTPYVVAYLPKRYKCPIKPGQRMLIDWGAGQALGEVASVLDLADTQPDRIRTSLMERTANQVARIKIDAMAFPATGQKVTLSLNERSVCVFSKQIDLPRKRPLNPT